MPYNEIAGNNVVDGDADNVGNDIAEGLESETDPTWSSYAIVY